MHTDFYLWTIAKGNNMGMVHQPMGQLANKNNPCHPSALLRTSSVLIRVLFLQEQVST